MSNKDSKTRFSNRVENYTKFRPSYPPQAIEHIIDKTAINAHSVIADIGSGTGKLTKLFLEGGFSVIGVEPNDKMRTVAETDLAHFSKFRSVPASAEETTLAAHSVDLVTAAQAFHWFDRARCKNEFRRILKPNCSVCLIWNRPELSSDFMEKYQTAISKWAIEERKNNAISTDVFDDFFCHNYTIDHFQWHQTYNFEELWGRTQSSSYSPIADHPNHQPLKNAVVELFEKYSENKVVHFMYRTEVIIGVC